MVGINRAVLKDTAPPHISYYEMKENIKEKALLWSVESDFFPSADDECLPTPNGLFSLHLSVT